MIAKILKNYSYHNIGDAIEYHEEKVKKNVEDSVQTDNIQDRLRNLSSWMEGPGSPGYEREKPDSDDSDAEEVNSEEA